MKENNLQRLLLCLDLCVFFVIFLSRTSSGADYPYEACAPKNCGNGPNISFPFYIPGLQESFCGYPGFALNCSQQGFPVLQLPENEYVVQDIFYRTRSLRIYDAAVLSPKGTGCLPRMIRNTTLPTASFGFSDNVTQLHLFSNCSDSLSENLGTHRVIASKSCERIVVAPVDGNIGRGSVDEVLRRGFVLNWTANDCSPCELSGGRCGFNATLYHFRCFFPDRPHSRSCLPGFAAALVVITTCLLILLILIKRKRMMNALNYKKMDAFLKNHGCLALRRYNYSELKKMTNSFSHHLGRGGYGIVYKGKSEDGRLLAVKILNESKNDGEEFMNEVASISTTSHVNIVTLLGFCFEGSKRALVYEFMPNGSLDRFICNTSLSDADRLANFGDVSHKSDVYSYGMMVLDIVGERNNDNPRTDHSSETYFPHWIYKHLDLNNDDGVVGGEECHLAKRKLAIVGLWCIQTNPKDRPSMSGVVEMLEGRVESLQVPPKPYLSSPSRLAAADDASISDSSM
ncbi:LEAF RUST 10 DISEASE-RESISTANCE LOCUS RECEPTOR-LIKE PROTEIN KINASE-like 2.1 [Sesamum alatum]|uniref:non-specific serine/threonine protein kinase n=1 Tax=Sesamum alatum TaxID=300844 RepID=A0AAE2CIL3_9LAMI|nr:LEAF RUST 10 DISEASE-RESISTANCE LOCUS RECEPTOR-LIKE PROTEIN KINASE-like 2.1 [Sesamum alatum]